MSERNNVPRVALRKPNWLHSEPSIKNLKYLIERAYTDPIYKTDRVRQPIDDKVRRVLEFSEESSEADDLPAHVIAERAFDFGELDGSILPSVRPRNTDELSRNSYRERLHSGGNRSDTSSRDRHSLISYESNLFRLANPANEINMENPQNMETCAAEGDEVDHNIYREHTENSQRSNNHITPQPGTSGGAQNSLLDTIIAHMHSVSAQMVALNEQIQYLSKDRPLQRAQSDRFNVTYGRTDRDIRNLPDHGQTYMTIKNALMIIPEFDGTSPTKLQEFLNASTYTFQSINPCDEDALLRAILFTKLKGKAMLEFQTRSVQSFDDLRTGLERRYSSKRSTTHLQLEFNSLKQRFGEDARTYGARVDKIALELYESMTEGQEHSIEYKRAILDTIQQQALQNFQIGLRTEIKTIVRSQRYTSLEEAIDGACAEERVSRPLARENRTHTNYANNYTRPSSNNMVTCQKCGKIGHTGQTCRTSRYAARFVIPKPIENTRINSVQKHCVYCKKNGHNRDECWNLHGKPNEKSDTTNNRRRLPHNVTSLNTEKFPAHRLTGTGHGQENKNKDRQNRVQDYRVNQVRQTTPSHATFDLVILPIEEAIQQKIPLLVDTGSAISLVKIKTLKDETPMIGEKLTLTGITGHQAYTLGKVTATIKLGKQHQKIELYVVRDDFPIDYEGILGIDFLRKHHAKFDYKGKTLTISGQNLRLIPYQTYSLPARSETLIQATVGSNQEGIIPAEEILPGIFIGNCLVKASNYKCPAAIINTTENAVEIVTPYVNLEEITNEGITKINMLTEKENSKPSVRLGKLTQQLRLQHLNNEERKIIYEICEDFHDTFFLEGDSLTHTTVVEHQITTRADAAPINMRPYRLPETHKQEVDKQIQKMLDDKIIRHSTSQWNAPLLVVPKRTGASGETKLRIVVDFRKLNDLTIGDSFPLPNINDILDQLGNAKYFSTLDLASGYHQITMAEQDKNKTAFSTPTGHYEFNRMPFGLKNAPATFQRLMNSVLAGLQGLKCLVYLDDIVIYGNSLENHNKRLIDVLQRIRHYNLRLQPDKCEFLRKEVIYLGHIISENGISPDPKKIDAVTNFPVPTKVKHIQSFIGLAGYYRRFIENFSKIARPLTKLTRKDTTFEWGPEQQTAFDKLKEKLTTTPVLRYPDFDKEFIITTDASDYAIGAILSQGTVGQDNPISYASRVLSQAERNYNTTEKELLAIVWAVKHYRPYVYGIKFKIITDHKPLVWLFNVTDPGSRLIRWRLKLEEYDYEIVHKAGKTNLNADALSRNPPVSVLNTNKKTSDEEEISYETEDEQKEEYSTREYTEAEKKQILYEYHNAPLGGHQGVQRTLRRIRLKHNWKGINADVTKYINKCDQCQKNKLRKRTKIPLVITDTPSRPFEKCALDVVGPLPVTNQGNKYILTFQDSLTKFSKAIPIQNQEANTIAKEFITKIIFEHGIPSKVLTDQGTNFVSEIFKNVCKLLKIDKIQTTAYHPESNGALERSHRTLAEYLRHYINADQLNWDEWTSYAMFTYNTTPHTATNFTPFELVYGYKAELPTALTVLPKPTYSYDDYAQELREKLRTANQLAKDNLKEEKQKSKNYYDKKTKEVIYRIGDKVLLYDETVRRGRSKKLDAMWTGPYEILNNHDNINYTIKKGRRTLRTHANRLKLYIEH